MSWQLVLLNVWLRQVEKRYLACEADFTRARARLERHAAYLAMPSGARLAPAPLRHDGQVLPALRLAAGDAAPLLLWLHGGAYCIGSPRTHAGMAAALALRIGAGAVLPGYRLAPEQVFPAAVEDVHAAWSALMAEGHHPGRIALGGDSAGGGLAFALIGALLAEGAALPAAVVTFSPWVDLTQSGASLRTMAHRDVLLPVARFAEIRDIYLAGADARDPRASPLFGRYRDAPPVLIQASEDEILRDDARAMAERLRSDGVTVALDIQPAVPHVWQLYHGRLPEADAALDRAATFLRAHLADGGQIASR